jgi:hypothetical protein
VMRNGTLAGFASGRADELAVYDQALSAAAVKEQFELGSGVSP